MDKKKLIGIGVAVLLVVAVVVYILMRPKKQSVDAATGESCVNVNRNKWAVAWQEGNIPGGDLKTIAAQFVPESESQQMGSVIGGFFKGIDVYPSSDAAKYYKGQIAAHLQTENALPYWSMAQGELLCQN